jgi:hypothetical protein
MCSRNLSPRRSSALFIGLIAIVFAATAQAQLSEGPHNPASVVNDACVVGASWFPTANAMTSDDMYAQVSPAGSPTECLKATDYGFNIPDPAEIKGIEVSIERHSSMAGTIKDASVKIVKGGTITGTEHADPATWPTSDAVATYGGSADLWGTTWTPTDINSSGFGASISAVDNINTASVDVIQITVFFDLCASAPAIGCHTAGKTIFIVKDKTPDSKDKMIWKWIKGQSVPTSSFGDPTVATTGATNALCIYEAGALIGEAVVGPSATLWAPISTKGFKYKDKAGTQSGITKIIQKASTNNKSKVLVKGKGTLLPDIHPMLTLPVDVQLVNSESGECFTSTFGSALKNQTGLFKAKN